MCTYENTYIRCCDRRAFLCTIAVLFVAGRAAGDEPGGLGLQPQPGWQPATSARHPRAYRFTNFAGQERYVAVAPGYVKLYLSHQAMEVDDPLSGFLNRNIEEFLPNSCGPVAVANLFEWYGLRALEPGGKDLTPEHL